MKRITLLLTLLSSSLIFGQKIELTGAIGKYKIEMELSKSDSKEYNVRGKYNYKGKTAYLDLNGNIYDESILQIDESYKGETTGSFYIEKQPNSDTLKGKWIAGKKYYDVYLVLKKGKLTELVDTKITDFNKKTNKSITGCYIEEYHFMNDMWFTEENPQIEIGYNGGYVMLEELDDKTIKFTLQKICGPTYHFASASGEAIKINDSTYSYISKDEYSDDTCSLTITIGDKEIAVRQQSQSFACGFGARAYADGNFLKIKNSIVKKEDEIFLEDIYKLEE